MTAAALVAELRARGVELVPAGDHLRFRPASKVPPELLACLRERKAEVLGLLTAPGSDGPSGPATHGSRWWAYPWPDELAGVGRRRVGPFDVCAACSAWTWVRYGVTRLCLGCARRRDESGRGDR